MKKYVKKKSPIKRWLSALALAIIPATAAIAPVKAAERVTFNYGGLLFEIEVSSLETFAKDGKIDRGLGFYLGRVDKETQAAFREALKTRQDVNPVELYRFLKTPMGEEMLDQIGNLVTIPGGRNGKYAIRAALGKAAFDKEEGLTLLNFLRQFPTDLHLDTRRILELTSSVANLINETDKVVAEIGALSSKEAKTSRQIDYTKLPDLRVAGQYEYQKQTLKLEDKSRNRKFPVDIYKPKTWRGEKVPVIVASHGLASNRQHFATIAAHLASYGYVVVVPEHVGSNFTHFMDMLDGLNRNIFELNSFIDRPKDISYILDDLERRNENEFQGRLDLKKVGVLGHSFGGYTALALAGAEINFAQLEKDCDRTVRAPNLSLVLQCQALKLPRQNYNFRDPRVQVIMAVNPVNSSIFGQESLSKVQIPVLFGSGSRDPATPAVFEQVQSFTWLTGADKYLVLVDGQSHIDVSQLDVGATELLGSISALKLPTTKLLNEYDNSVTLAFFENYLVNNREYRPFMQSTYTEYISEQPFGVYMLGSASSQQSLKEKIAQFTFQERRDPPSSRRDRDPG